MFGLDRNAPIGLAAARIERCAAERLTVVAEPNLSQRALGGLFLLVASYFGWSLVVGVNQYGWLGLWPGVFAAPFFAVVALVLCLGSERVEIEARGHRARIERRLLAWRWRDEVRLPSVGNVTVRAIGPPATLGSDGAHRQYGISLADASLPRFTCNDRGRALALAQEVAELLGYRYVEAPGEEQPQIVREPPLA